MGQRGGVRWSGSLGAIGAVEDGVRLVCELCCGCDGGGRAGPATVSYPVPHAFALQGLSRLLGQTEPLPRPSHVQQGRPPLNRSKSQWFNTPIMESTFAQTGRGPNQRRVSRSPLRFKRGTRNSMNSCPRSRLAKMRKRHSAPNGRMGPGRRVSACMGPPWQCASGTVSIRLHTVLQWLRDGPGKQSPNAQLEQDGRVREGKFHGLQVSQARFTLTGSVSGRYPRKRPRPPPCGSMPLNKPSYHHARKGCACRLARVLHFPPAKPFRPWAYMLSPNLEARRTQCSSWNPPCVAYIVPSAARTCCIHK